MNTISFEITGATPLMMHNERLANPMDSIAKQMKKVSSKKSKTDEDFEYLAYLEFQGGLYHDGSAPYIPLRCVEATIRDAAKRTKRGKDVARGIQVIGLDEERAELIYDGAKDVDGLWKANFFDQRTVKVTTSRVLRTRPIFRKWSAKFDVIFDAEIFNRSDIIEFLNDAGKYVGICEYRPRYGRFTVEAK